MARLDERYELNGSEQLGHGLERNYGSINSFNYGGDSESQTFINKDALQNYERNSSSSDENQEEDEESELGITMRATPIQDKTTYFRDGQRKIDFMLVYEEEMGLGATKSKEGKWTSMSERKLKKHEVWRSRFIGNLTKTGLEMEEEVVEVESARKRIYFIKLHAPWVVMCYFAEELSMRAPLQAHPNPSNNWSEWLLKSIRMPNLMYEEVPNKPLDYYTCPFKKNKIDRFLDSDNHDTYFTPSQRSRIVYEILATATFGKRKKGEVGIDRLVDEGTFTAAFPLHDGKFTRPEYYLPETSLNARQVLYHYWARWGKWYKYQPLDHIREYFGEKIAVYFAWLGFYTGWLLPVAIVGLMVFLYGVGTINHYKPALEVCKSGKTFKMCPRCDEKIAGCSYWYLSDICAYARVSYLFDHPGTVFFAIFVSFWAVTFLEYWKRKCASLAHHWDSLDYEEEEERPRPAFAAKAPSQERNPVTGIREPSFPKILRLKRIAIGAGVLLIMIVLVIIFIVAVIIYRVLVSIPLFQNATFRSQAQAISSMSGAVVNLILIMAMGRVYEKLALKLTQWEMHRTQTEFDDNLTFKVFIFQFVNFYSSIFYIAFFKGRFVGYPGHYKHILGLRNEDCSAGGCLIELAQQLAVIMIGKQIINNAQEILIPKLKGWWQNRNVILSDNHKKTRWEEDYQLVENEGLFQEYLEMVLQFGFITIFVAAFPLAPLFALLNNWVEVRLDAQKFVCETRRAVAERAQDIGVWFKIMDMLAHLAVISNAFLIAFTSEFLPKLLYQYETNWDLKGYTNFTLAWAPNGTTNEPCRYKDYRNIEGEETPFYWKLLALRFGFVIIFEHIVFGICRIIDIMVPDVPESLELKIKRERYLAKQALQDSEQILQAVQGGDIKDEEKKSAKQSSNGKKQSKDASQGSATGAPL